MLLDLEELFDVIVELSDVLINGTEGLLTILLTLSVGNGWLVNSGIGAMDLAFILYGWISGVPFAICF